MEIDKTAALQLPAISLNKPWLINFPHWDCGLWGQGGLKR